IDATARRFAGHKLDGVLSTDEYVGAAIAAAVARKLDLPGADPAHIVTAQHKYFSRVAQKRAVPEAVPDFALVPLRLPTPLEAPLPFPFFVKAVKGTFSVFAAKVDDEAALRRHLNFRFWERFLLSRVTRPFNQLVRALTTLDRDANFFIGEQLISGVQVTL